MGAIPSILNVLLVCVVFWLLFNIVGVKLLGQKFWKCKLEAGENNKVENKSECAKYSGKWTNGDVNFDHVGMGYLALLQVVSSVKIYSASISSRKEQLSHRIPLQLVFLAESDDIF